MIGREEKRGIWDAGTIVPFLKEGVASVGVFTV